MTMNRRDFLKATAAASAAASFPSIWLRAREASALEACESGVNFVIVQLGGGNDGINTVIPMTDGSGQNRTTYDTLRPWLRIAQSELGPTQVGNDPLHNGNVALHPHMTAMKSLYDSGNLSVVLGAHYANGNLSHEQSEFIWYRADPLLSGPSSGWMGRSLDNLCSGQPLAVPGVDVSSEPNPLFNGNTSVLAFSSLSSLNFPSSYLFNSSEASAYKTRFLSIFNQALSAGTNYVEDIGVNGYGTVSKIDDYKTANLNLALNLNDLIKGTNNGGLFGVGGRTQSYGLATGLRLVFALMKGKQPGNVPLGCRIFRVSIGGFDTHGNQGQHIPLGTKSIAQKVADGFVGEDHGELLHRVDKAIGAFWRDLVDNNMHGNTVIMTFSEFGRRIEENGDVDPDTGTDHGTAAPMFVVGPTAAQSTGPAHLAGGMYGAYPELNLPDGNGNMVYQIDFRKVYGDIINKWLGVSLPTTISILGAGGFTYTSPGVLV